jgi:PKD repeat protein
VLIEEPTPAPQPPTAVIIGPANGLVGESLSFDANGSSDSDGSIVSYAWDFGDGATGSGVTPSHAYNQAGDYTVRLTVTDNAGLTGEATHAIRVDPPPNQPPTAAISGPASGLVGDTLNFNGGDSNDSDGNIVSYAWDFGDGATSSGVTPSHAYNQAGDYTVRLTVTDNAGLTGEATHAIRIDPPPNQPPTAAISAPDNGLVGDALPFDGTGSSDSDGSIASYAWNFGDGNTGIGMNITHSYVAAGNYQVTLTVTDDGGLTNETIHSIQIDEAAPANLPPAKNTNNG